MFCRKCGKEIDEDSKFCMHCGMSTSQEPQKMDEAGANNNDYSKNKIHQNKIVPICLLTITSIIILSIVFYGLWKGYVYGLFYTPSTCDRDIAQKQLEKIFPKEGFDDEYFYGKHTDKNPSITKFIKEEYDKEGKYSNKPFLKSRVCEYQIKYKRVYSVGPYYVDERNIANRNKESLVCFYMWDNVALKEIVGCTTEYNGKKTSKMVTEYPEKR